MEKIMLSETINTPIDFKLSELEPLLSKENITGKSKTPNQPILVGTHPNGKLYVSDGSHRYHEAVARGETTIKGYHEPKTNKHLSVKQAYKLASETNESIMENKMEDLFNEIESDKLSDAKDTLASALGAKMADAIDVMRKEIASKLTGESVDEGKISKNLAKMFTNLKKEPHVKVKSKPAHMSDEDFEKSRDDFYKGHGRVGEELEEDNTYDNYEDRIITSDKPAPKNSNTVGKSKKEVRFGKVMDSIFKHAAKNTEESNKKWANKESSNPVKKCCEDEEIK